MDSAIMGCPVRETGVELRDTCSHCLGTPSTGLARLLRHQVLYVEGAEAQHVFAVVDGFLRESRSSSDGRTQGIRVIVPGDVIGLEAFLGQPYRTTVEALSTARVCRVPARESHLFLGERPKVLDALNQMVVRQALELKDTVHLLGSADAETRILSLLGRLTSHKPAGTWVRLPVTRKELAELAGLADPTVSRIVQRMAREGSLEVRGRWIRVVDPSVLPS